MALIQCPECGREISDKVAACPHCGYPFTEQGAAVPSLETMGEANINSAAQNSEKGRRRIIGIIGVILVLIFIAAGVMLKKANDDKKSRNAYIDDLNAIKSAMLTSAIEAEDMCILVHDVWYNTIYEEHSIDTDAYTRDALGNYHEDFNDSLQMLFDDPEIVDAISSITDSKESVDRLMKRLQNPIDEFSACYETLDELYDSYYGLVDLAVSPSGSLMSYTDSYREYDGDFGKCYEKLGTLIPEKQD